MKKSQSAVIFGASGTIGRTLAKRLKAEGWTLLLAGRSEDKLRRISTELESPFSICDATKSEDVKRVFEGFSSTHQKLDAVVSCIGSLILTPITRVSDSEWHQTIETNLTSSFYILRESIPLLREQGGSLTFCTTAAAEIGLMNHEVIAAAKAGIVGLVKSAAASYARSKIRVNAVAPGLTKTDLTAKLTASPAALQASEAMHPLGFVGEPENIASALAWMMSPEQNWVTGQVLAVDGGLSTLKPPMR